MGDATRRSFGCLALGALTLAASRACAWDRLEEQRQRLIVSVMALRGAELVADEAATYTPFQQNREQVLTLEIGPSPGRSTVLINLRDADAGGVRVSIRLIGAGGQQGQSRDFTMYPFVEKAAVRVEALEVPPEEGIDDEALARMRKVELQLVMKRVIRRV